MMIECPRCGFEQPKDQFCASCGLDIDQFISKPKPALVRLVQNPNLHLSLIGILIVLVIGYIFYSQRELVSRQMGNLLDAPVSSRDAGDPNDTRNSGSSAAQPFVPPAPAPAAAPPQGEVNAELAGDVADEPAKAAGAADAVKLAGTNKLEITAWEVPREALANLIALAEKVGESQGGRAYLFPSGSKISSEIQSAGQKLAAGRSVAVRAGGQLTVETPPTTGEAFQFGLLVQLVKVEGKDASLKWESQLVLPQAETPGEAASINPSVRATVEATMNGSATLTTAGLLLLVLDPPHRSPREEFLARAGEGPWSIFSSQEFRSGLTEWVMAVQIK